MKTACTALLLLPTGERAFSLVEVLLVLALLALGGTVLISSAGTLWGRGPVARPEDAIAAVLQQVRREAVLTGREIVLRFDRRDRRFSWDGATGSATGAAGAAARVDFLRPRPEGAVLLGGRVIETNAAPVLRFFPDGTCDPVRLQLREAGGAVKVIAIDPWTCAPGLEARP